MEKIALDDMQENRVNLKSGYLSILSTQNSKLKLPTLKV